MMNKLFKCTFINAKKRNRTTVNLIKKREIIFDNFIENKYNSIVQFYSSFFVHLEINISEF